MNEGGSPLVSVIIPTYNRAEKVKRAALSVLNQTEGDLELIVVDDGSEDDTRAALSSIGDPRLRVAGQARGGACRARNLGVSLARGAFVAFHDSDDLWRPDKLEKQLRCLRETGADLVFAQIRQRLPDGSACLFPSHLAQGFVSPGDSLLGAGTQTLLARREVFLSCPFDPDMPRLQEFEMLCRVRRRYSVYFLEIPLADYAPGGDSISADPEKLALACRLLREKQPELFAAGPSDFKSALAGRLRLEARRACLGGSGNWKSCLSLAAEMDDREARRENALAKAGLYPAYIRLREALRRQKEGNTPLWRAAAFPVRRARRLGENLKSLRQTEQLSRFRRKKSVFGPRLARQWALAAAADALSGHRTHAYHRRIRRFLDGELAEIAARARALPEPPMEEGPLPVWTLWWEGEEAAPPCVKLALNSQKRFFRRPDFDYHILTRENFRRYIETEPSALARYERGEISLAHLSDALRCALLLRHGGLWIDATVYMTAPLTREALGSFYTVRKTPGAQNRRGQIPAGRWACYLLRCRPGDPLAAFLTEAYEIWWKRYGDVPDYYLLDELIDAAYRQLPRVKREIDAVPVNNERIFDLYDMRNEAYLPEKTEAVLRANSLHKLSWKDRYLSRCPDGRMTVWQWMREEARREV